METNVERMATDIHLIATPFRFIRNLIGVFLAVLFAPAILVLLIVGSHVSPDECAIAKVLIGVFGPLVFSIWFAGVIRWCERSAPDCPSMGSPEGRKRASALAAYFCGLAWVGILLSLMSKLTGIESLWAMVLGLFSPAIIYILGRIVGMWLTKMLAIVQVGATVFLFGRGLGFF